MKQRSGDADRLGGKRVLVTGAHGFLGRHLCRQLEAARPAELFLPRHAECDLTRADAVEDLLRTTRPEVVFHLAAEVGGIGANRSHPGRFFYSNMAMGLHLIEASRQCGVGKFIQVGTVCAYPKYTSTPFLEDDLWDGYPEETNAPYAIAKKALLVMLQAYRAQYDFNGIYLLCANLYGPGDHYDLESSHVIPALIEKCLDAKRSGRDYIECWGTGSASREFLFVEDCARGIVSAAQGYDGEAPVNLGTGSEISIRDLVTLIAELCDFHGEVRWDPGKPDGQPRRRLSTERAERVLGFAASTKLRDGLRRTIRDRVAQRDDRLDDRLHDRPGRAAS